MRGATLRQLRAFSLVARHHSFGRAAAELHLTPSAVSLQIKDLEHAVGLPLFGRSARASQLTAAGEILLVDVNRALRALKDADDAINRLRGVETGLVSIGMVSNAKYFLPRLLAGFHASHPGVELHVAVGNREQLLRHLGNGEVDFAIMGQPPRDLDALSELLGPQPLGIIAAPEHRLTQERAIDPQCLATEEFIVREAGSGTRAAMDRFFHEVHISPPLVVELSSNESIKQAVIGNMGLAFLSLHTAGLELQNGILLALDVVGLPLIRSWNVVHLKSGPLSEAAESLRRFIVEFGGRLLEQQFGSFERSLPIVGGFAASGEARDARAYGVANGYSAALPKT
jgi:DNA-binding transcriptional LysR family regulator